MWYKNNKTGKTWDITDKNILKRVSRDPDYEPVEEEEEELPFVPEEEIEEEVEEETPEEEPVKKAGGRNGRSTAKTKK